MLRSEIEFILEAGPLGMELEEVDGEACAVKAVHSGGQAETLALKWVMSSSLWAV